MKKYLAFFILLLVLSSLGVMYFHCGEATNTMVQTTVVREAARATEHLSARLDARCDSLESRLERIEGKLDRLLELAVPQLPDDMSPAGETAAEPGI